MANNGDEEMGQKWGKEGKMASGDVSNGKMDSGVTIQME
jgi:hypothetical protein